MSSVEREDYRRLRAEWLKLRGSLFDANTHLPTLPSLIDEIRSRLEAGERLGLIYVDPSDGGHLETCCGWQAYDELLREMGEAVAASQARCLERGDLLAMTGVRSDELVAVVSLEDGGCGDVGLEARRELLTQVAQDTLDHQDGHPGLMLQSAAIELETDPQVRLERSIYQALHRARELCRRAGEQLYANRLSELGRILAQREIVVRYQPIIELSGGEIHGHEALSAATSSRFFDNAGTLFSFAEETDRILDLERLCRREAIHRASPLVGGQARRRLFLNCSPHGVSDPELAADLVDGARQLGTEPHDLVLEITERVAITEWESFRRTLGKLRAAGLQIAIDDMGSGYSSLQAVAEIAPDYLKIDMSLISGVDRSTIKQGLLESMVDLAAKIGARAIAEGIERPEELATARRMGVTFGQGFLFARPAPPDEMARMGSPIRA